MYLIARVEPTWRAAAAPLARRTLGQSELHICWAERHTQSTSAARSAAPRWPGALLTARAPAAPAAKPSASGGEASASQTRPAIPPAQTLSVQRGWCSESVLRSASDWRCASAPWTGRSRPTRRRSARRRARNSGSCAARTRWLRRRWCWAPRTRSARPRSRRRTARASTRSRWRNERRARWQVRLRACC